MDDHNFRKSASTFRTLHRGAKHLDNKVNGETRQTQADQIIEVQAKKRM